METRRFELHPDNRSPAQRLVSGLLSVLGVVFAALLLSNVITNYFVHTVTVEGPSMQPTLVEGDVVWVTKIYRLKRGDVVIFPTEEDAQVKYPPLKFPSSIYGKTLIKRIVAVGGDQVTKEPVGSGASLVWRIVVTQPDGTRHVVTDRFHNIPSDLEYMDGTPLPEGWIYVMGDNYNNSEDSTNFGPIPESLVEGKALFIK